MYINGESRKEDFVKYLNGKNYKDLIPNMKRFIKFMFPCIEDNTPIKCKYINNGKVDIEIVCMGILKRIMIKSGVNSLLHVENIHSFVNYLRKVKVSKEICDLFLFYHFGDGTIDGLGKKRYCGNEIRLVYEDEIEVINRAINQDDVMELLLERILCYDYYQKKIHYLYYGNLLSGLYIEMDKLKQLIKNKKDLFFQCVHVGKIHLYNMNRNVNFDAKAEVSRNNCGCKINNLYSFLFSE